MKGILLKCSLDRCNLDGTQDMNLDKCAITNGSPCYYLLIKNNADDPEERVWSKFDEFVNKSKKGPGEKNV